MAVIGQSHLLWRSRVPDHISHSNTIVRIVPIEVVQLFILFNSSLTSMKEEVCLSTVYQTLTRWSQFLGRISGYGARGTGF